MTGAPSRAIRRQAEKAHKTASKLLTRGVAILEKTFPDYPECMILSNDERDRLVAGIGDIDAAIEIDDTTFRALGITLIEPPYRLQIERTMTEAKGFLTSSLALSETFKIEGH